MICLDEMGPESAKSHPGQRVVRPDPAGERRVRAIQEIDYGRRGKGHGFAAFRPAAGQAPTQCYARRQRVPGARLRPLIGDFHGDDHVPGLGGRHVAGRVLALLAHCVDQPEQARKQSLPLALRIDLPHARRPGEDSHIGFREARREKRPDGRLELRPVLLRRFLHLGA